MWYDLCIFVILLHGIESYSNFNSQNSAIDTEDRLVTHFALISTYQGVFLLVFQGLP